jgi:acyl-coenzyme A thioesterase PaaI-like protein
LSFSKACTEGTLTAEAVEVTRSAKLVMYEARIRNADGDIVAVFNGTGYIKGKPAAREKR